MNKSFSLKIYLLTYLCLMFLLVLTVFLSTLHLNKYAMMAGLVIAGIKAFLIVALFMHAGRNKNYYYLIFALLLFGFGVFLLTMSDFKMRLMN